MFWVPRLTRNRKTRPCSQLLEPQNTSVGRVQPWVAHCSYCKRTTKQIFGLNYGSIHWWETPIFRPMSRDWTLVNPNLENGRLRRLEYRISENILDRKFRVARRAARRADFNCEYWCSECVYLNVYILYACTCMCILLGMHTRPPLSTGCICW